MERSISRRRRAKGAPRSRRLLASALVITVVAGASVTMVFGNASVQLAGTQLARSLSDMVSQRSPGVRSSANLTNVKADRHARRLLPRFAAPRERALGKIFPAGALGDMVAPGSLGSQFAPSDLAFSEPALPDFSLLDDLSTMADFIPAGSSGSGFGGFGPSGFIAPSGGGGGDDAPPNPDVGPIGPGPTVDTSVPPVVASVPEPGTWLTMLLGFFAVGLSLRRARPHQSVRVRSQC
jgi:hypothetical protein